MPYVDETGTFLFNRAPKCVPVLRDLELSMRKPAFAVPCATTPAWCAASHPPPFASPPDVATHVKARGAVVVVPLSRALFEWIQAVHRALKGKRHTLSELTPLPLELQQLMDRRPIDDYGILLDRLDYAGRPLAFDVAVHGALIALT